jgi:hypothetical protein
VYLFANIFGLYVGPIPNAYPQIGDVTFIAGFVISAVLYYVTSMGLRKPATSPSAMTGTQAR